jgi:hypothetical protein
VKVNRLTAVRSAFFLGSACLALIAGCARQTVYQPPSPPVKTAPAVEGEAEATVSRKSAMVGAYEVAWQRLLARAQAQKFAVEKTDRRAGRVQLRYSGDPMPHVDCGSITTKVVRAQGEASYTFPGAVAQQRYEINRNGAVFEVERRMTLDAQIDVTFTAIDARRTRMSVGTMYRLKREQTVQGRAGKPLQFADTIGFTSDASATFPNAATRCEATGRLEQLVLGWVKP